MDQITLKKELHYDPITGVFTRLRTNRAVKKGDIAGVSDNTRNNTIRIGVLGKYYDAHRLAFMYMWGYFPNEVDHIDHDTTNNSWVNLRIVTHKENGKNQKKYKTNSSGVTGVNQRSSGSWRARIFHEGKHIDLGTYLNKDDAIAARKEAEIIYNFHRNHGI